MTEAEVREIAAMLARFPIDAAVVDRMVSAFAADDAYKIRAAAQAWQGDRFPTVAELRAHGRPEAVEALEAVKHAVEDDGPALTPGSGKLGEHWRKTGFEGIAAVRAASEAARNRTGPGRIVGSDT